MKDSFATHSTITEPSSWSGSIGGQLQAKSGGGSMRFFTIPKTSRLSMHSYSIVDKYLSKTQCEPSAAAARSSFFATEGSLEKLPTQANVKLPQQQHVYPPISARTYDSQVPKIHLFTSDSPDAVAALSSPSKNRSLNLKGRSSL